MADNDNPAVACHIPTRCEFVRVPSMTCVGLDEAGWILLVTVGINPQPNDEVGLTT